MTFAEAWAAAHDVEGWLTKAQGSSGANLVRKGLVAAGMRDAPWPH